MTERLLNNSKRINGNLGMKLRKLITDPITTVVLKDRKGSQKIGGYVSISQLISSLPVKGQIVFSERFRFIYPRSESRIRRGKPYFYGKHC